MQRRQFISGVGAGSLALGAAGGGLRAAQAQSGHRWRMATTWPNNFPGLGTGANQLAALIGAMSGGRVQVQVYGAGALVPAAEVFAAVGRGTVEMGHGCASYWPSKGAAVPFFSSIPFGMTAAEVNAWLYHGGGQALWDEAYAPFGLVPAAAGNTGVNMGGWFNKEICSAADLSGLKFGLSGLGGEVLARAGGTPITLSPDALLTALQSGVIDGAEWVGPYADLALGLYAAAKYYYYPGWHEPGTVIEALVNKKALDTLPADLRAIVLNACKVANQDMLAEFTARNPAALNTVVTKHQVELRCFPDDVIRTLHARADEVIAGLVQQDAFAAKVHASYMKFLTQARAWSVISAFAYLQARDQA